MKFRIVFAFFFLFSGITLQAQDFQALMNGNRLIMKGTHCAGLEFIDEETVALYDEMICSRGSGEPTLEAHLKWISDDTFILIEQERTNEECPPGNWVYKIESFKKDSAKLRVIWTGWGKHDDELEEYKVSR